MGCACFGWSGGIDDGALWRAFCRHDVRPPCLHAFPTTPTRHSTWCHCGLRRCAADVHDTRLLFDPAISGERIAFAYANDLWVANLDGTNVQRLNTALRVSSRRQHFSPDGKWIAYSGRDEGNTDVCIGGNGSTPKRLTWHPANDRALQVTPDGKCSHLRLAARVAPNVTTSSSPCRSKAGCR